MTETTLPKTSTPRCKPHGRVSFVPGVTDSTLPNSSSKPQEQNEKLPPFPIIYGKTYLGPQTMTRNENFPLYKTSV